MNIKIQIGVLLLLFAGCKDATSPPLSLDPYERWKSYNIHDYTIDQIRSCFCPYGGQTMRITVRSDTISSVKQLSDNSELPASIARAYLTVDSLFATIRTSTKDSLVITYEATYGYPTFLDINPQTHAVDGGVAFSTSNLQIP